jgi:hypothetical protein
VNRQWAARDRLLAIQAEERRQTEQRETAPRFGSLEVRTRLTIARGFAQLIATPRRIQMSGRTRTLSSPN